MRQSWHGGQFSGRRTLGLPGGGAHEVTCPIQIVCQPDNPKNKSF
jgi:hypothetical protein